jgi:hypothetical protein
MLLHRFQHRGRPTGKDVTSMGDQLDVPLEDSELLEEVEMVSTLILAASENDDRLDQAEIDRILGVDQSEEE